jgi:hypothetical protein
MVNVSDGIYPIVPIIVFPYAFKVSVIFTFERAFKILLKLAIPSTSNVPAMVTLLPI